VKTVMNLGFRYKEFILYAVAVVEFIFVMNFAMIINSDSFLW
jgi:hypothetical protein